MTEYYLGRQQFNRSFKTDKSILLDCYYKRKLIWVSQLGTKTLIQDLEDAHLNNCINYVKKRNPNNTEVLEILELEKSRRINELVDVFSDNWKM